MSDGTGQVFIGDHEFIYRNSREVVDEAIREFFEGLGRAPSKVEITQSAIVILNGIAGIQFRFDYDWPAFVPVSIQGL